MTTTIFYSPDYLCEGYGVDTREKAADIAARLAAGAVEGVELREPAPATAQELQLAHSRRYVQALLTGRPDHRADQNGLGPWSPGLRDSVLATTGGVIAAARHAFATRTNAGSLSSGLHHAKFDHGSGFCTVNGLAIAAKALRGAGARRVMILDLDAHCGGGTASLIDGIDGIEQLDISVNRFDAYTEVSNSRLVITDGENYLRDLERHLDAISARDGIDLLLYNAGMDPHERCPTGGADGVTTEVLAAREKLVFDWAASFRIPVAFALAGGYSGRALPRAELTDLHLLTVREAARRRA